MIELLRTLTAEDAAQRLLGSELMREHNNERLSGIIVETEAYHQEDPAAHSFNGKTQRNQSMFLSGGHAYVYLSYGIHHCMNIVCGKAGSGEGVLIRALEPVKGVTTMQGLRGQENELSLTNGPGKLTQALDITKSFDGHWLEDKPLKLQLNDPLPQNKIQQTTRIGISRNMSQKLRFYIKENKHVSKR